MKSDIKLGIILIFIIGGGLFAYYYTGPQQKSEMAQVNKSATDPAQESTDEKSKSPEFPVTTAKKSAANGEKENAEALPKLKDSAPVIGQELLNLFGENIWTDLFQNQDFIRSIVITVENLNQPRLPPQFNPVIAPPDEFLANKFDKFINPKNYSRYEKYVTFAETLNLSQLTNIYVKYYSWFQQASEENQPNKYFNDELVHTLDRMIATPEPKEPIAIVRGIVSYKYQDEKLESLSSGQKILLRIGPSNRAKIKTVLIQLRKRLAHLQLDK